MIRPEVFSQHTYLQNFKRNFQHNYKSDLLSNSRFLTKKISSYLLVETNENIMQAN
jgi:hypothetical protein